MKKRKYESVSHKMGLERLEKSTPKTCLERAALIERKIKKGEVPKVLVPKARKWIITYRARAKALRA